MVQTTPVVDMNPLEGENQLLEYLATQVSALSTQNAQQDLMISYLATRGPAPVTGEANQPLTPSPIIVGGVEIEEGQCCIGGIAGDQISITVGFSAIGLDAPVLEMRYKTGSDLGLGQDLDAAPWLPFSDELEFVYPVPLNWTGFYIHVQYRDSLGNVSPIFSDDISVEGMPPLTPSPGD
jgi:hypothetical protein